MADACFSTVAFSLPATLNKASSQGPRFSLQDEKFSKGENENKRLKETIFCSFSHAITESEVRALPQPDAVKPELQSQPYSPSW